MEGIGTNKFVYNGIGNAYIQCFFFATKTAISIGKNPKVNTENNAQIVFMLFAWLFGVFVFAVLVGQIKEIIAQSTRSQDEYKKIFDNISQYMIRMQVGPVSFKYHTVKSSRKTNLLHPLKARSTSNHRQSSSILQTSYLSLHFSIGVCWCSLLMPLMNQGI